MRSLSAAGVSVPPAKIVVVAIVVDMTVRAAAGAGITEVSAVTEAGCVGGGVEGTVAVACCCRNYWNIPERAVS